MKFGTMEGLSDLGKLPERLWVKVKIIDFSHVLIFFQLLSFLRVKIIEN